MLDIARIRCQTVRIEALTQIESNDIVSFVWLTRDRAFLILVKLKGRLGHLRSSPKPERMLLSLSNGARDRTAFTKDKAKDFENRKDWVSIIEDERGYRLFSARHNCFWAFSDPCRSVISDECDRFIPRYILTYSDKVDCFLRDAIDLSIKPQRIRFRFSHDTL
jgi:hypothetical protein